METTEKKAALFVLLGQSNAVGHGVPMTEGDKITVPLKNVHGLHRRDNQSFGLKSVTWSGYTGDGMNLAETQDHTYSVANCLAACWQARKDRGEALPDLYIVHIAIGAQGIAGHYMWNPGYPKKLVPGRLGTVDIALYPFTMEILKLVKTSFAEEHIVPEGIRVHWIGGENDTSEPDETLAELPGLYSGLIRDLRDIFPAAAVVLHRIVCPDRMQDLDPTGIMLAAMERINRVFEEIAEAQKGVSVFDPRRAPYYVPEVRGNGIFVEDAVHFTPEMNRWKAEVILRAFTKKQ